MKRHLLPLLLLAGVAGLLPAHRAQAQDKPVLNSAPPGPPATQPRPAEPAPAPTAQPAPAPEPASTYPAPQPSPDAPSGLDFPNRKATKAGGAEDEPPTRKFIYTNFGLGFSSYNQLSQFNISAAPALGFRLNNRLAVGPGISYAYSSYSVPDGYAITAAGASSISTSSVGVKAFAQFIVYREFFLHAEYEVTNAQLLGEDGQGFLSKINKTVSTPLAGVGYRSQIGDKAAFDIVGLYNFDNSIYSLYPGLVVRFSLLFNIGK
ncbi:MULTISPECIES: hypothetical protein [Hymenobacter]|uniref:Outer membrane protein beta-barrel domain-containing protein n=1 Tax=Hymenobacter armeniacus TaxID=2771358 RepID=A0ABR8JQJ3_9BACT|nr:MULTISPECIES: hypothetical protein [Hymenobacter]MBD2721196.1 hypothetical protein [Hymenobacter armeniacus]MBJ6109197.1 hypothetical protein [Hymenobacter sp. BT523]